MKFRMYLKPIEFEANDLQEANDTCSEILIDAQLEVTNIEEVK